MDSAAWFLDKCKMVHRRTSLERVSGPLGSFLYVRVTSMRRIEGRTKRRARVEGSVRIWVCGYTCPGSCHGRLGALPLSFQFSLSLGPCPSSLAMAGDVSLLPLESNRYSIVTNVPRGTRREAYRRSRLRRVRTKYRHTTAPSRRSLRIPIFFVTIGTRRDTTDSCIMDGL